MLSAGAVRPDSETEVPGSERYSVISDMTWWENGSPDRTEFPRKIDEFRYLGIAEVGEDFAPPADVRGRHFRRYPRPGQGVLSGRPTLGLLLVLVSPRSPEQAQAF